MRIPRGSLVLAFGLGALFVQGVVIVVDVVLRHTNPVSNQPRRPSA